ncbi:hypothetical protein B7486_56005 [cyanobacterium TDX16]|nr:hypothetical protein B7486_56005 [cyanobacterium TDX16]
MQLGAVDRLLGEVIDVLEANGTWDEAAVAVVADHGLTFEPGRLRDGVDRDVTGVPLIVKAPGQTEGRLRDEAALTIDVVPTLLGLVGVQAPDAMDGLDLNQDEIPEARTDGYVGYGGVTATPDQSEGALRAQVLDWASWIAPGDWAGTYALGDVDGRQGTSVEVSDGASAGTWRWADGDPPAGTVGIVELAIDQRLTSILAVADRQVVATQLGADAGATAERLVIVPTGIPLGSVQLVGTTEDGSLVALTGP